MYFVIAENDRAQLQGCYGIIFYWGWKREQRHGWSYVLLQLKKIENNVMAAMVLCFVTAEKDREQLQGCSQ